jgi:hypothetical protein
VLNLRRVGHCGDDPFGRFDRIVLVRLDLRQLVEYRSRTKTGEQLGSPWLHHVKGELLLVQNPSDIAEAERGFRTAIEIARRQSARSPELRASTSLARLLAKQGRRAEARAMLGEI